MALVNVPPLADFENILRSRLRDTQDRAETFLELLVPPKLGWPNVAWCICSRQAIYEFVASVSGTFVVWVPS